MSYLRFTKENGRSLFVQEEFIVSIEPSNEIVNNSVTDTGLLTTTRDRIAIIDSLEDVEEMFVEPTDHVSAIKKEKKYPFSAGGWRGGWGVR